MARTTLNLFIGFFFKPSSAAVVVGSRQDELQLILALSALILFVIAQQFPPQKAALE